MNVIELLVIYSIVVTILAIALSFVWVQDADSPLGDGMIMGCLLLVFPLWPITMTFWLWYVIKRHSDG